MGLYRSSFGISLKICSCSKGRPPTVQANKA
ncbi:hypothetical protein THAOC_21114, partial [Thalassiosira oceanica]